MKGIKKIITFLGVLLLVIALVIVGKEANQKDIENRTAEHKQRVEQEAQQTKQQTTPTPDLSIGRMWIYPSTDTSNLTWYRANGLISVWLGYDWFFTDQSPKNKLFIYTDGDMNHYRVATPKHRNFNIGRPKSVAFRYEGIGVAFVDVYAHPKPRNVGVYSPDEVPHY